MKLIYKIINFVFKAKTPNKKQINEGVKETLRDFQPTLKYLEKYDKGQISDPQVLADHRSLRSYIQSL